MPHAGRFFRRDHTTVLHGIRAARARVKREPGIFPLYPDRYEADTAHLSMPGDGAYNRLLRLLAVPAVQDARRRRVDISPDAEPIRPPRRPQLIRFCGVFQAR